MEGIYISPIIEFTEDDWTTRYQGTIIEKSLDSYLISSTVYGTFWIPKINTRIVSEGYWCID